MMKQSEIKTRRTNIVGKSYLGCTVRSLAITQNQSRVLSNNVRRWCLWILSGRLKGTSPSRVLAAYAGARVGTEKDRLDLFCRKQFRPAQVVLARRQAKPLTFHHRRRRRRRQRARARASGERGWAALPSPLGERRVVGLK